MCSRWPISSIPLLSVAHPFNPCVLNHSTALNKALAQQNKSKQTKKRQILRFDFLVCLFVCFCFVRSCFLFVFCLWLFFVLFLFVSLILLFLLLLLFFSFSLLKNVTIVEDQVESQVYKGQITKCNH